MKVSGDPIAHSQLPPLLTTCIGAYPKPDFVRIPDWFSGPEGPDTPDPTGDWLRAMRAVQPEMDTMLSRGCAQVVKDQEQAGIDILTDGEVPRENYIHYHCRHLEGIDFSELARVTLRNGAYAANLPTIRGPVGAGAPFLLHDWRRAQAFTRRPVKITMPGPMTIADTTVDNHYHDTARLQADLATALNHEVLALAHAGCTHIQVDEPLFARKPNQALEYGIENVERVFHGCPPEVVRTLHMCCGYPDRLDNPDYPKADRGSYRTLAGAIDESSVMAVSLEDAHRHNDLSLLENFESTTVILGVVAVARSRIEPVEEIRARLQQALEHIDSKRLIPAPDCGLGLLGRDLSRAKLGNLCEAAHAL